MGTRPRFTAEVCRENYWRNPSPVLADAHLVSRFERNGFELLKFITALRVPEMGGRTVEQLHFSGHLVREGYWVDMHLSMMPYQPSDRQVFLDFVGAIKVAPKGK